jgi:hypothetical protein
MGVFLKAKADGGGLSQVAVVGAVILLVVFGVLVYVAELNQMPVATQNAWAAFQAILGVIVGFLGGESLGRGQAERDTKTG